MTTFSPHVADAQTPKVAIAGDWTLHVSAGTVTIRDQKVEIPHTMTIRVAAPATVAVTAESYADLPLFNPNAGGWAKGARLKGVATQETTASGALVAGSVVVAPVIQGSPPYVRDKDYALDEEWGTLGRLPASAIGEKDPVFISYRYEPSRLDTIVVGQDGKVALRRGEPRVSSVTPPALEPNEFRLANIWVPGQLKALSDKNIFLVTETAYPALPTPNPAALEKVLPNTLRKLKTGEPLKILAWGDSVTDGVYLPSRDDRWQVQFVQRLKALYPKANIELASEAWGGRNTATYLGVPPGEPHNYQETVLAVKPDLIISEFVNDAGLTPAQVEERYSRFLDDFQKQNAEWIILTPHYVILGWMGLDRQKNIDDDPRPYVAGLRQFAQKHPVALADASLRWGRLWRQGIPYLTLLSNNINHPDPRGMKLFADSLVSLFETAAVNSTP